MSKLFNDFQKQELKFDINKLNIACKEVLKIKGFNTSLDIPHLAGIDLNHVPGESILIKRHNVSGVFCTKLNNTCEEVQRNKMIDKNKYTKYLNAFNGAEENRIRLVARVLDYKFN